MKFTDCHKQFVNLDHRTDRLAHMTAELSRVGIEATRLRGMPWKEYNGNMGIVDTMMRRTPGAIGCHFSQVQVMKNAQALEKDAFVMEDDLIFCNDFFDRMKIIEEFTDTHEWDVIWLGASFHVNPPYWHKPGHSHQLQCNCNLGKDAEVTDHPNMMRTYGAFCTFAYIVNFKSMDKIFALFDRHLHTSIGIDWLFIKLEPQLKTFSFVPGCVRQMDNQSDIGNGVTHWSGFLQLNGTKENSAYVFQNLISDFDPTTFNWAECK